MPDTTAPPAKRGGRERGSKNRVSSNSLSLQMRIAVMASFNVLERGKYLVWLAQNEPMAYAMLLKALFKNNDSEEAQGLTIVVQQLPHSTQPIAGVINSPIREHIAGPRLIVANGAVIDVQSNEPRDG